MSKFDYKQLTKNELEEMFVDFPFQIPPMRHQMISIAFAAEHDRVAFFHGVGTGKTLTSLWTSQLWENKKILVVCPSSAFSAWERDISKYTNYTFELLTGSGKSRKAKLKKKKDIFIINYEGLKTIYASLTKGMGWRIDFKLFIHNFDCIILDEVHKCKSYNSLQSKICFHLSKIAKNVMGLTGTAVDNSLLEVFNIYKVIDLGKTLGTNFFYYRMNYFKPAGFDWKLKSGAEEKILEKMSKSTLSFDREECFDLPEIQEIVRTIEPPKEFITLQNKVILGDEIEVNGDIIDTEGIEVRAHLLRELSGGFLYYKVDEEKKVYRLKKNAKIEALIDLLDDTSGKVIIFYLFTEEGKMIQEALRKQKYKFISIQGGQKTSDRTKQVKKFQEDSSVKCAVVQQSAGAEGWDGSIANVAIFFTGVSSPKTRKQTVGRIHRKGQTNSCLVIDLVLKNSIDKRVLKNRSVRFNFVKEVMSYIQEFGGIEEF